MKIFGKELLFNNNKVYHAGSKPTASEIGAAASSHTHNYAGSSSAGGAANSATVLATARTINGTSFNGSANITTSTWGIARNITIGNTTKSINGSGNVSWSLSEIGAAPSSHTHSYLPLSGGTLTGNLTLKKGFNIHVATGTSGSSGYVAIANITITSAYMNQPIEIVFSQRNRKKVDRINILFASANSTDPGVESFTKSGYFNAYILKTATSKWKLYIQKTEVYDQIDILDIRKGTFVNNVTIDWINEHVTSIPSGFIAATPERIDGPIYDDRIKTGDFRVYDTTGTTNYFGNTKTALVLESSNNPMLSVGVNYHNIHHDGYTPDKETGWFRGSVRVTPDGVMETGKYIDFHLSNDSSADYDGRLTLEDKGRLNFYGTFMADSFNVTSDRNLKKNIEYIRKVKEDDIATLEVDSEKLTLKDMYNFVKDELVLATYNMKNNKSNDIKLNFIAQDLLYNNNYEESKVGQLIVNAKYARNNETILRYDTGNYTSVLAGALQYAIDKIEILETMVNSLTKQF